MKFAQYLTALERDAPQEWQGRFIQYKKLKKMLKVCLAADETDDDDDDDAHPSVLVPLPFTLPAPRPTAPPACSLAFPRSSFARSSFARADI